VHPTGYLLFPDPRELHHGGETIIGYGDGSTIARDAYGRTPLDPAYAQETLPPAGKDPLARFKGEFAERFGRKRRGRGWNEPEEDSQVLHEYHLSHAKPASKRSRKVAASGRPRQNRRKRKRRRH
jgi:hypothetical protein